MFGDSGFGYQSVGFGATTDGVYLPGAAGTGGIALTTAWGVRGAFNHNWDPVLVEQPVRQLFRGQV